MPVKKNREFEIDISTNLKERAIIKMKYHSFARYCYWMLMRNSDGEDIFYVRDLRNFAKTSHPVAYNFFIDLINLGLAEKHQLSNNVMYFTLTKNDGHIKLKDFLPYIKKTLS